MFIFLYDDLRSENINLNEVSKYLNKYFSDAKISIITLTNFLSELPRKVFHSLCLKLVNCKVRDVHSKVSPLLKYQTKDMIFRREFEYEKNRLADINNKSFGNLYDGFEFAVAYSEIIHSSQKTRNFCHILFTNQIIGTYSEDDRRYHLRTAAFYMPLSVISTNGIVEAPAKPREYYLKKQAGIPEEELKKEFVNKYLHYDDTRLTEVLKGFAMQAMFYYLTGEPFCKNKFCRLYNAHWQEELIQSQLKGYLCRKHSKILKRLK